MIPKDQRSAWTQQKHRLSAELPPPDDLEQAFGICSFMIMYGHVGTVKGLCYEFRKQAFAASPSSILKFHSVSVWMEFHGNPSPGTFLVPTASDSSEKRD